MHGLKTIEDEVLDGGGDGILEDVWSFILAKSRFLKIHAKKLLTLRCNNVRKEIAMQLIVLHFISSST